MASPEEAGSLLGVSLDEGGALVSLFELISVVEVVGGGVVVEPVVVGPGCGATLVDVAGFDDVVLADGGGTGVTVDDEDVVLVVSLAVSGAAESLQAASRTLEVSAHETDRIGRRRVNGVELAMCA